MFCFADYTQKRKSGGLSLNATCNDSIQIQDMFETGKPDIDFTFYNFDLRK